MAEDESIRRLRRLLGNQRFEEETSLGQELQKKEDDERAAKEREAWLEATDPFTKRKISLQALEAAQRQPDYPKASNEPPASKAPSKAGSKASAGQGPLPPAPLRKRRVKPKSSPYSDTESETDSDTQEWSFNQEAGPEAAFVPIMAASKYPYKYMAGDKDLMERIADSRFNNSQFWDRKWNIFYIHPPQIVSPGPIFFMLADDFQKLLDEVSSSIGVKCGFPAGASAAGFRVTFSPNEPRPRYLAESYSRDDFNDMDRRVPQLNDVNGAWSKINYGDSERSFQKWQAKLEESLQAAKQKKQRSKAGAGQKRLASKLQWCRQLRRSQRYLGLRAPNAKEAKGAQHTTIQDETSTIQTAGNLDDLEHPPKLDVTLPPQFPFDEDVVFVCIDIEAHETMQTMITELGICTLDTRDLKAVAPGPFAENWRRLIKYRHFRINEYRHHTNSRFVSGCPDRFEKEFGESEFIPMSSIAKVLAMTCKAPFPHTAAHRLAVENSPSNDEPRKIVLVGHGFDSDIDYLRRAGFQILKLGGLVEVLDTSMVWRAMTRESNPMSLAGILNTCHISGWNLHNAGNDAAYTLQALLAMAVESLANPYHRDHDEEHAKRREHAIKLAAEREDNDFQEWLLVDRGSANIYDIPD